MSEHWRDRERCTVEQILMLWNHCSYSILNSCYPAGCCVLVSIFICMEFFLKNACCGQCGDLELEIMWQSVWTGQRGNEQDLWQHSFLSISSVTFVWLPEIPPSCLHLLVCIALNGVKSWEHEWKWLLGSNVSRNAKLQKWTSVKLKLSL